MDESQVNSSLHHDTIWYRDGIIKFKEQGVVSVTRELKQIHDLEMFIPMDTNALTEEEKQKLFQQKVKELEELFRKQSLDKLKDINLLNTDGQEDTTSIGLVEKRGGEGSEGVGDSTESDD